ncbi:hypothetical protein [Haloarchaeobius sp. HME9146]|uniref:hypothetical protein n=1 Tax=Haloarchaeobius sp. HME9146 TaxID=2978732 RepID=UPI0021C1A88A|nr:hypothetical protein [Haloarchaeobius sp. HME9146]MCT9095039.1 hypothetical protein [Haloarchaeobius sp. HME9146]
MTDQQRVGVLCAPDHTVFAAVADSLRDRGVGVTFYDPEIPLDGATVAELDAVVSKKTRPATFTTLRRAADRGIPAWNDFVAYCVFGLRLVGLHALDAVGFRTPPVSFTPPEGEYVAKTLRSWEGTPVVNEEGDFYQPLLPAAPIDHKYYCVDDGEQYHVRVLEASSKLEGEKRILGHLEPDPELAAKLETLAARTGAHGVGVDIIHVEGEPYAVDVNPAPSFRETGLEAPIVDSIASLLE